MLAGHIGGIKFGRCRMCMCGQVVHKLNAILYDSYREFSLETMCLPSNLLSSRKKAQGFLWRSV